MGNEFSGMPISQSTENKPQDSRKPGVQLRRRVFLMVLAGILLALMIILALLPRLLFPPYEPLPTTGKYSVGTLVTHWADPARAETYGKAGGPRTLAVEFWYPQEGKGRYPLVLFSHGAFGNRRSNESLFRELASHGYVVCSLDHTYQCLSTNLQGGKRIWMDAGYAGEIIREDAKKDPAQSLEFYRKWMGIRTGDIQFVLDTLLAQVSENPAHPVFGLVDSHAVALIGHSLGGSAVLGVGRARGEVIGVIALEAPFLCDIMAVENGNFVFDPREYPVPLLCVYSDASWPHLKEWPQYAQNARFLEKTGGNMNHLYFEGVGHLALTDLALASPFLTRIMDGPGHAVGAAEGLTRLNQVCLSFLNRYGRVEAR
ncbi:MAG: hypothetical protein GXY67_00315 [Clostridiales bacterium]|nr:hypothetical protein [Clostridiales bacterium]